MDAQNPTALHAELPALLSQWLPQQRWFAAKGRSVGSVTVAAVSYTHLTLPTTPYV